MPFKSESQRRKFASLVKDGKISQKTYNEWDKDTPEKLPEKATPKYHPQVRTQRRVRK